MPVVMIPKFFNDMLSLNGDTHAIDVPSLNGDKHTGDVPSLYGDMGTNAVLSLNGKTHMQNLLGRVWA